MHRELNDIEYFNWCVGQPYNMVGVAEVSGDLRPEALRDALGKAQERHPLLRVNTEVDARGLPWFTSAGVGAVPLRVVADAAPDDARSFAEGELTAVFAMDDPPAPRLPLMRVSLFLPRDPGQPTALVITAQHVIADGLSLVFLVRDLLRLVQAPGEALPPLDAPASAEDLFPVAARRRMPRSALRFRIALAFARLYVRIRFGRRPPPARQPTLCHRSWTFTQEETARLRARCRREAVSVQSAICTSFLPGFGHVHTPVSLRPFLARPVGESVGLYVGAAEVTMKYRDTAGFWENARGFHRRLRKALRDPFRVYRLFSKAVPVGLVKQLGPLMVRLAAARPFGVTNLGQLDGDALQLRGPELRVESFFGAVTGIVDASVLTVYTLGGRLRLHLLANESGPAETTIRDEAEQAIRRLRAALEVS